MRLPTEDVDLYQKLKRKVYRLKSQIRTAEKAQKQATAIVEVLESELRLAHAQMALVGIGGTLIALDDEGEPITTVEDEEEGEPIWRNGVIVGYSKPHVPGWNSNVVLGPEEPARMVETPDAEDYMIPDVEPVPDSKTGLYGL